MISRNDEPPDEGGEAIRSIEDLAAYLGVERPDQIAKAVFKGTECGCAYDVMRCSAGTGVTVVGVVVRGYAEGSDAECPPHELKFPFTIDDWDAALEEADEEGCEMWHAWNDEGDPS
jgi:hypothetical protein